MTPVYDYWRIQEQGTPLFPDIEWAKPEQRSLAGKLAIIGGNSLGFAGVAEAYSIASEAKVGEIRVLLPDTLKRTIPKNITEAVFAPSNPAGGLGKDARADLNAVGEWASGVLLIGDVGRNSESAILYEDFLTTYSGQLTISRDAIDVIKNSAQLLVERPQTLFVASFAQLQKLFQNVYFPKILTFNMQLSNLVETLHKFTVSYPITILTLHRETLLVAHDGQVITMAWENPMSIWRGSVATRADSYWLWNKTKPLESITASLV